MHFFSDQTNRNRNNDWHGAKTQPSWIIATRYITALTSAVIHAYTEFVATMLQSLITPISSTRQKKRTAIVLFYHVESSQLLAFSVPCRLKEKQQVKSNRKRIARLLLRLLNCVSVLLRVVPCIQLGSQLRCSSLVLHITLNQPRQHNAWSTCTTLHNQMQTANRRNDKWGGLIVPLRSGAHK